MRPLNEICVVVNRALSSRILDERTENVVVESETRIITDLNCNPKRFRPCLNNGDRLRVTIVSDKERFAIRNDCMTKRHCLSGGSGFIKQRGIGYLEPG